MQHVKHPETPKHNSADKLNSESNWESSRRVTLQRVVPQLTGRHWVQFSQQANPLLCRQTTDSGSLWVEVIEPQLQNPNLNLCANTRLTTFSRQSADGIICDQLIQSHPQPERIIKEIRHVLRPGGWVLISGAGSLRGKQAAGIASECLRPQQIAELLASDKLKLIQCYSHANNQAEAPWKQRIEQWRMSFHSYACRQLPSLLPLLCAHANTRPGWLMLFKDETLGMTPLASPLKSRAIKLQANSAISLYGPHGQQEQSADATQSSISQTSTTRAA